MSGIFRLLLINVMKRFLYQDKKRHLLSFVSETSEVKCRGLDRNWKVASPHIITMSDDKTLTKGDGGNSRRVQQAGHFLTRHKAFSCCSGDALLAGNISKWRLTTDEWLG